MKEVFVVYGRDVWNEGIFDQDDNYFGESTIFGVFESFESALKEFRKVVKKGFNYVCKNPSVEIDPDLLAEAIKHSPFENYNTDNDDYEEGDIQWYYYENNDSAEWQMYAVNVDSTYCPILPGIYLKKQILKP